MDSQHVWALKQVRKLMKKFSEQRRRSREAQNRHDEYGGHTAKGEKAYDRYVHHLTQSIETEALILKTISTALGERE